MRPRRPRTGPARPLVRLRRIGQPSYKSIRNGKVPQDGPLVAWGLGPSPPEADNADFKGKVGQELASLGFPLDPLMPCPVEPWPAPQLAGASNAPKDWEPYSLTIWAWPMPSFQFVAQQPDQPFIFLVANLAGQATWARSGVCP